MIARHLRAAAEWLRNRRAARRRASFLRCQSEALLDLAQRYRAQAQSAHEAAEARPEGAERTRLQYISHRLMCEAIAYELEAGGDRASALMQRQGAAFWAMRAAEITAQMEAAHA